MSRTADGSKLCESAEGLFALDETTPRQEVIRRVEEVALQAIRSLAYGDLPVLSPELTRVLAC